MVREILGSLDTGILALVGLMGFIVAFVAILVYAFSLRKTERDAAKQIPLADPPEVLPTLN